MSRGPTARLRPGRARLSRSADFDRVIRRGRSHASREFVLYVFPREESSSPRLGLSVSRKVGGAVQRNRVKRLLREAFALEAPRLPEGTDAVVVARQDAWGLAERQGLPGVREALADLIGRAVGTDEGATSRAGEVSVPRAAEDSVARAAEGSRPVPADDRLTA